MRGPRGICANKIRATLYNLNVCGIAPVIACGFVFGGAAQLIAGLMEFVMGNAFGFPAFTGYVLVGSGGLTFLTSEG